ncbi:hypothetical protein [Desulfosporosinus shakirovi]|uniref:hypothetical protein n=1 Tax=Desulfosporosinus shakirovi TaxID=2885154 RepID=UPI001E39BB61|nr:hypothetical protein [Desulfosporosinus sp. SRJS8]MCB8818886.1 hypothetical protein [Desulfosporosinus sp. SRJS8]
MKIYNKKGFWSGIFFLLVAVAYIILLINDPHDMNTVSNVKSIFFAILCVLFGVSQVYRGLDSKRTKEDEQNDDERKKLVTLKAESTAFRITFNIFLVLTALLILAIGVTKYNGLMDVTIYNSLLGIFVGVAIVPSIMVIAIIGANIYHDKRT